MGHSVHPYSFRIGVIRDWKSRWFKNRVYRQFLKSDIIIREWLEKRLRGMYISNIEIERGQNEMNLILKTSRPGLLIGRGGEGIEKLRKEISGKAEKLSLNLPKNFKISVQEVKAPETHSKIVAQMIAEDLEKRMKFRRILNQALEKVMANKDVKGVKVALSGRLDGAEMARYEWLKRGQVPLTTLRADIDFARERAHLPYGDIGIKVWIYKGEVFEVNSLTNR
ncbi:30S ribosomal protein S3 [Candidatus Giovannonibacteria bacterium RIFCSPLOWO2_02_FULL_43_11b]|uniref:Small ribosomal subunit protein uS3 n=1 Tax=Candidatus Giovannonibacteria bacterium RIFCSPHIGHO2_12_FULL_43_15 TaxID=1798341 RepID=A0A1F5WR55_9BACT|nr:MAG: 30S ribosomal protein S3 [Candidatus Giovannonibacteria bacterium RIFCSPHIGHO2_01_FULL_43_100]OGF66967.1 MAG: 30S ribosomal protein S3 [Candidatus Giovannonibacteria bacterium RIFCSPHIGHO2_02_FULL_43_32]OGF78148.1 MAG: 30S ribosomal protein S3 [Candidatus Giovannonibacteria bacterium RIFCSPHIGHO2_12_FULL_43_15]OGF78555.1 MAG: 30S ribosomal protein S3 [Candidatus Giovannonibacteria bacterium RIFCSPLOWO2_01_FULL_43_60]OGF89864.1 MAG: 30S ribosomal protein S3 [Candidatus Giovannonibacteria